MKIKWMLGFVFASLLATQVTAQQLVFKEGVDYDLISPSVKTSNPEKIVVTELFWYGCPHCFRFEPYVEHWAKTLPAGVIFEQVPSVINPRWVDHAKAFYALKMMGVQKQVHKKLFDAIHVKRQRLMNLDSIAEYIAEQGLDEKLFRDSYASFPVDNQVRKNGQVEKRYGHNGVPAVVVNGKYLISAGKAGSNQRLLQIANFLIGKEMAQ